MNMPTTKFIIVYASVTIREVVPTSGSSTDNVKPEVKNSNVITPLQFVLEVSENTNDDEICHFLNLVLDKMFEFHQPLYRTNFEESETINISYKIHFEMVKKKLIRKNIIRKNIILIMKLVVI